MSDKQETEYGQGWICEHFEGSEREYAPSIAFGLKKFNGAWIPFSQRKYINGCSLKSDGLCSVLTVMFLGHIAQGKTDFIKFLWTQAGKKEVVRLCSAQNHLSGWTAAHMEKCGLKQRYVRVGDTIEQISELIQINGLYDFSISDFKGEFVSRTSLEYIKARNKLEGHGMAAVATEKACLLFDPNFGIFLFQNKTDLGSFLKGLFKSTYKAYDGTTMLCRYSL